MMNTIRKLLRREDGATAIEYGLIAALIGVVIIGATTTLGSNIKTQFNTIGSSIGAAT